VADSDQIDRLEGLSELLAMADDALLSDIEAELSEAVLRPDEHDAPPHRREPLIHALAAIQARRAGKGALFAFRRRRALRRQTP